MNILKKINILFVEDEQSILEKYSPFLETYCKTLYTAMDGNEAYEVYKEKKPNVILMDLYMPECTGIELAKKIREEDSSVAFIALSGHSDRDT
ncbi:MAG: response regulator, partial [Sulfurovaceae bacterium]|nr:response regulator [Sulfurovaceae bacterium]